MTDRRVFGRRCRHHDLPILSPIVLLASFAAVALGGCGLFGDDDGDTDSRPCTAIADGDELLELSPLDGDCYSVDDSLSVHGDVEIEPDTAVYFHADTGLSIAGDGQLTVRGSAEDPVRLRGENDEVGHWRGIRLVSSGPHRIEHAVIGDAGSGRWDVGHKNTRAALVVDDDQVTLDISDAVFKNNEFAAISTDAADAEMTIASSHFEQNDVPMRLEANHLVNLDADLEFTDNRDEIVAVHTDKPALRSGTWRALSAPYQFEQPVRIEGNVEIEPGTTLRFEQHAGLDVDTGLLEAVGTIDRSIRFVGANQTRGYWRGIRFRNTTPSAFNRLDFAEILHAGSQRWVELWSNSQGNVLVHDGGRLIVDHTRFANGAYHGLTTRNSVVDGCTGLEFDNIHRHETHSEGDDVCFE